GEIHAFLWQNGMMTDLGTLGGDYGYAYGINNKGQKLGESETETGETHAFLWQNGVMTDLGTLGGSYSRAFKINENGQIIGKSETGTGETHATLWTLMTPDTKLLANFSAYTTIGKAPLKVQFTDLSKGSPTSWSWSFGDRRINWAVKNPVVTFKQAGRYTVTLTVKNAIDKDTLTRYHYIVVK
ncbi:MAG: hypothetical protein QG610_218, partial [Euryarchaeota archaeon]|nr:hypothetical protein [Euryarchaeota archaeon]